MPYKFSAKLKPIVFSILLVSSIASFACINDADTLFFESQQFPNEIELMSGDFVTHTKEFYKWRVEDRLKKLQKEPNNLSYYDDLAVSYEKIGQTDKAIATLEPIYKENPNRYETIANLGTFYIHNKEYKKGLELLKKAVVINPNAHFGREIYQIKLVEYLLKENPTEKITFPIQKSEETFADFILRDINENYHIPKNPEDLDKYTTEILKAIVGIGGMLKFGNSDSPILLEAMGDLYNKLDFFSSNYAVKNETTGFGKIALLFYTAAITRSNHEINQNDSKFNEYLKTKNLSTTSYFDIIENSLENYINNAKKKKEEYAKNELEYINKGGDVEGNIYKNLYPLGKKQEDLLANAKKSYLMTLDESKSYYYQAVHNTHNKLKDRLTFNAKLFGILLGFYYFTCIPVFVKSLYRRSRKKEEGYKSNIGFQKIIRVTKYLIGAYLIYNTINIFYTLY